jgi:type I restriction enzyme R subunit
VLRAGRRFQDEKRITVATLQSMVNVYRDYSAGYFDLIVTDECHRSIYGKWSGILKYFDGVQVGLTATPFSSELDSGDEEDKLFVRDTLRFFEVSEPTFRYTLPQAVHEGYLVPYQIYKAQTVKTAAEGGFDVRRDELDWTATPPREREEFEALFQAGDPISVDPNALERKFTIPERNRAIVRELQQVMRDGYLDQTGRLRKPLIGKTIVFAVTKRHAETLAQIFDEAFAHEKPSPDVRYADFVVSGFGKGRHGRRCDQDQAIQEGDVSADPGLGEHARYRIRCARSSQPGDGALHPLGRPLPSDARPGHAQGAGQGAVHSAPGSRPGSRLEPTCILSSGACC